MNDSATESDPMSIKSTAYGPEVHPPIGQDEGGENLIKINTWHQIIF